MKVQLGQRAARYARVSTADQSYERQLRDLTGFAERGGYEVIEVFRETASGMKANRSARAEVMKLAQTRHIDAILVTELSRWGRSTQDQPGQASCRARGCQYESISVDA